MKRKFRSSKEIADIRRKRNSLIVGLLLIFLMVFSIISYSFYGNVDQNDLQHNGYTLSVQNLDGVNVYTTKYNGETVFFYSAPLIAYKFKNDAFEASYFSASTLVFTRTPPGLNNSNYYNNEMYYGAVYSHVAGFTDKRIIIASTEEDLYNDLPILTCDDANANRLVFVLNNDNLEKTGLITLSDYCFRVDATNIDILSFRDYILYVNLGVKNG